MQLTPPFQHLSALSAAVIAALACATVANADFNGSDPLRITSKSNWYPHPPIGGAVLRTANSRLEFQIGTPATVNSAFLWWQPNQGGHDQDWYVQADAYLDLVPLQDQGDGVELGLAITPSGANGFRFFSLSLLRSHYNGNSYAGISTIHSNAPEWEKLSNKRNTSLRMHFDSAAKTITPSWNSGTGWQYGQPRNVAHWNMGSSETFLAALYGRNQATQARNAAVVSGQAYFRNFKTGDASPEMVVGKSIKRRLKNGSKVSLGSAVAGTGKVTRTYRIWNQGTATLDRLEFSVTGRQAGDFMVSGIPAKSLAPGESATFKLSFSPKSPGSRNAALQLRSNTPDPSSFTIKLAGMGRE